MGGAVSVGSQSDGLWADSMVTFRELGEMSGAELFTSTVEQGQVAVLVSEGTLRDR